MGAGPKAGSFAAECGEAAETLTCLACVCVAEVQRDGGGEGTSGPQLVSHSLNLLPAAIPADGRGLARQLIISLAPDCPDCGAATRKEHVSSSIRLAHSCQLVSSRLRLPGRPVGLTSTRDKQLKSEQTVPNLSEPPMSLSIFLIPSLVLYST